MADILDKIVEHKREELKSYDFGDVMQEVLSCERVTNSMSQALRGSQSGIIAEFKRKSPSKGWINIDADPIEIIVGYGRAGAAACSVLTNEEFFGGSLEYLKIARELMPNLSLLRKEFIIDARQIYEARVAGADTVLLIASCLSVGQCSELADVAHSVGLEVLLEVHTPGELAYVNSNIDMLGVNNRNLGSFVTDIEISFKMAEAMRESGGDMVLVSESGLSSASTIRSLREVGFRGFLIGETFMKSENPPLALEKLIARI